MILKIYAIYDKDAQTFNERTFHATNDTVAKRIIANSLAADKMMENNKKSYELHCCGSYDTESGGIQNILDNEKAPTTRKVCELAEIEATKPAEPTKAS